MARESGSNILERAKGREVAEDLAVNAEIATRRMSREARRAFWEWLKRRVDQMAEEQG